VHTDKLLVSIDELLEGRHSTQFWDDWLDHGPGWGCKRSGSEFGLWDRRQWLVEDFELPCESRHVKTLAESVVVCLLLLLENLLLILSQA